MNQSFKPLRNLLNCYQEIATRSISHDLSLGYDLPGTWTVHIVAIFLPHFLLIIFCSWSTVRQQHPHSLLERSGFCRSGFRSRSCSVHLRISGWLWASGPSSHWLAVVLIRRLLHTETVSRTIFILFAFPRVLHYLVSCKKNSLVSHLLAISVKLCQCFSKKFHFKFSSLFPLLVFLIVFNFSQ